MTITIHPMLIGGEPTEYERNKLRDACETYARSVLPAIVARRAHQVVMEPAYSDPDAAATRFENRLRLLVPPDVRSVEGTLLNLNLEPKPWQEHHYAVLAACIERARLLMNRPRIVPFGLPSTPTGVPYSGIPNAEQQAMMDRFLGHSQGAEMGPSWYIDRPLTAGMRRAWQDRWAYIAKWCDLRSWRWVPYICPWYVGTGEPISVADWGYCLGTLIGLGQTEFILWDWVRDAGRFSRSHDGIRNLAAVLGGITSGSGIDDGNVSDDWPDPGVQPGEAHIEARGTL